MKAFVLWVRTRSGGMGSPRESKRFVVIAETFDQAYRHGRALGTVTSLMEEECDGVAVLSSKESNPPI